jgi:hypothetical protein
MSDAHKQMQLPDDDRMILELFCRKAEDIKSSSVYNCERISLQMDYKAGQERYYNWKYEGPGKEAFISVVTSLRQFYANKERINFLKNIKLIDRYLSEEVEKQYLRDGKRLFIETLNNSKFTLVINDNNITPQKLINLWFYGSIFHSDIDKARIFDELCDDQILGPYSEFIFKTTVIQLSHIIIQIAGLIRDRILNKA